MTFYLVHWLHLSIILFLIICFFNVLNLIHLFIDNQLSFIILLKRSPPSSLLSSYYLFIYWETIFLDSIPLKIWSFFIVLQLQANNWIILQINLNQVNSFTQSLRPLKLLCKWWEYDLLDTVSTAPWYLIGSIAVWCNSKKEVDLLPLCGLLVSS